MLVHQEEPRSPEERLWQAVLHAYLKDIGDAPRKVALNLMEWSLRGHFETVCDFAGYDAGMVRDTVRRIVRRKR